MKRYVIDSIKDIQEFFTDLHVRTRKSFSPEEDLEILLDTNGTVVFSKAEAAYFDDVILDCFVFCSDHRLDLHEIVEGLQQQLKLQQAPACSFLINRLPKPDICTQTFSNPHAVVFINLADANHNHVAEWRGKGLQRLLRWFKSIRDFSFSKHQSSELYFYTALFQLPMQ